MFGRRGTGIGSEPEKRFTKQSSLYTLAEMPSAFIAHVRKNDLAIQTVEEHLLEVSSTAGLLASKFRLEKSGSLIGLVHDFGKFSDAFQNYIRACVSQECSTGVFDFDIDDIEDAKSLKGKIDHSTAGAQFINSSISRFTKPKLKELCAQILCLAVVSHHGGLIDCIDPDGHNKYAERISKSDDKTHFFECASKLPANIRLECDSLISIDLIEELAGRIKEIFVSNPNSVAQPGNKIREFYLGCLSRCLYSCLVDADRISSADFEDPQNKSARMNAATDWNVAIARFEEFTGKLGLVRPIDRIRRNVSDQCRQRADDVQGIYSLTVPTGGGKTFASLRYALHHAAKHKLDRIIYVIPYTSIIEQNAQEIRKIFEVKGEDPTSWVLEHHSNLEAEQQTWQSKLLAENWDAPIVVTTMVQFLEAWFGGGTRCVRRLHQMANSVLIFDEVQTLPVRCVHMFCNALNFITMFGRSTALLCTATQPVLNELHKPDKGQLVLAANHELVGDKNRVEQLFTELKRVEILNRCKEPGWNLEELSDFALQVFDQEGSCLIVVNTKAWAHNLYLSCSAREGSEKWLFHLSTNQCPAHRKKILADIKRRLNDGKPVLCISTQLIEAGVDISFNSVIRFLAGLDSIAQAAGRCNRHGLLCNESGKLKRGKVYVVNPEKEAIERLGDIVEGQKAARRVFSEDSSADLLSPDSIRKYFQYYFFERAESMVYPVDSKTSLLNLLSDNSDNNYALKNDIRLQNRQIPLLMQSFASANKKFEVIDAPTKAVIVPFGEEGRELIVNLCSSFDPQKIKQYLRIAQKYSVNVFPHVWKELCNAGAVSEISSIGVFYLDKQFYSEAFGLATEKVSEAELMMV